MVEINVEKLHHELETANIIISGCDSNGTVWDRAGKQIQDRADVLAVIGTHDPAPLLDDTRQEEYHKVGVNSKSMLFALWKKVMASDGADADALQSLMDGVDALLN